MENERDTTNMRPLDSWPWASPAGSDHVFSETQAVYLALADLGRDVPTERVQEYLRQIGLEIQPGIIEQVKKALEGAERPPLI
jgi:hypothetical protein